MYVAQNLEFNSYIVNIQWMLAIIIIEPQSYWEHSFGEHKELRVDLQQHGWS